MVRQDHKTHINYGTASLCFIILSASLCRLLKIRCRYDTTIFDVCKGFFMKNGDFVIVDKKSPFNLAVVVSSQHIYTRSEYGEFMFAHAQILKYGFVKLLVVLNRKITQAHTLYFAGVPIAHVQTAVVFRHRHGV